MVHPLIGVHAALGELGVLAFLWVLVELIDPTEHRIKRAKKAAFIGMILFLISWIIGGYYYVEFYGSNVKPIIKEGPVPWAHGVFMETKEHVFLFLPFLSFVVFSFLHTSGKSLIKNKKEKNALIWLCALIVFLGLLMALMGYIISTGYRFALEVLL